jgi:outer membrane protein OmpA-like peptidoglycan-associated protein
MAGPGPLAGQGEALALAASPELSDALAKAGLEIGQGEAGVVLSIFDLRFAADSDALLASEKGRLDLIARALSSAPGDRNFLVEGHAAATGKPAGELELSRLRAKRIVDELVARGLAAPRFIYRGLGSSRPVAPNDTEAGKARNRRVEITILE